MESSVSGPPHTESVFFILSTAFGDKYGVASTWGLIWSRRGFLAALWRTRYEVIALLGTKNFFYRVKLLLVNVLSWKKTAQCFHVLAITQRFSRSGLIRTGLEKRAIASRPRRQIYDMSDESDTAQKTLCAVSQIYEIGSILVYMCLQFSLHSNFSLSRLRRRTSGTNEEKKVCEWRKLFFTAPQSRVVAKVGFRLHVLFPIRRQLNCQ